MRQLLRSASVFFRGHSNGQKRNGRPDFVRLRPPHHSQTIWPNGGKSICGSARKRRCFFRRQACPAPLHFIATFSRSRSKKLRPAQKHPVKAIFRFSVSMLSWKSRSTGIAIQRADINGIRYFIAISIFPFAERVGGMPNMSGRLRDRII